MPLPKPPLNVSAWETNWAKLPNKLISNRTSRMMAKIIQPRPRRGLGGGGAVMTGGGGGGTMPEE